MDVDTASGLSSAQAVRGSRLIHVWVRCAWRYWMLPLLILNFLFGSANLRPSALAWAVVVVLRLAVVDCFRPEPHSSGGKLRVMLCGDSFAPKIDGVATRTAKGARWRSWGGRGGGRWG